MLSREVTVRNREGLHLRLASLIAQEAQRFSCSIELVTDGQAADAKSIFEIILLAAGPGTMLRIRACGDRAWQALERIHGLIDGHGRTDGMAFEVRRGVSYGH